VVVEGMIGSSDRFFAQTAALQQLKKELSAVECVETEGAAVAQVCHEYAVPCAVMRMISKSANESAPADFPRFTRLVAGPYSLGILRNLIGGGSQVTCPASPSGKTVSQGNPGPVNRLRGGLPGAFIG
jgi:adenosylhomocysteine nucleosidase